MPNALVRARLRKVWVQDNGDRDIPQPTQTKEEIQDEIDRLTQELLKPGLSAYQRSQRREELAQANDALRSFDEDNVVVATLRFPRSGESAVTATRKLALGDGQANGKDFGNDPEFFSSVLFKEEIQGEAQLEVQILDRDPKNPVLRFLRGLASTVFGKLFGGLTEGISHVVSSSAAGEVSDLVKSAIKADSDTEKVHGIAESAKVTLGINPAGALAVTSSNANDTYNNGILTLQMKAPRKLSNVDEEAPNGQVVLLLEAEAV